MAGVAGRRAAGRRSARAAASLGLLLIAVLTSGCGQTVACTLIGGLQGLQVGAPAGFPTYARSSMAPDFETADATTAVITVCVQEDCRTTVTTEQIPPWTVADDRITDAALTLKVTVVAHDGSTAVGEGTVDPRTDEPNGPDCGAFHSARVELPGDGSLVQTG